MNNIETITLLKVDGICFETNDNVLNKIFKIIITHKFKRGK